MASLALLASSLAVAEEQSKPQMVKHRVTGLFSPDRQDDLRAVVAQLSGVKLVNVDYDYGEATFEYDPSQLLNRPNDVQHIERFDNLIRSNSQSTFGIQPLSTVPREKLQPIEIPVYGLDCKGCCLAAYESIAKLEGVVQATVSFKEGKLRAKIDPDKASREQLEAALKQRGIPVTPPAP